MPNSHSREYVAVPPCRMADMQVTFTLSDGVQPTRYNHPKAHKVLKLFSAHFQPLSSVSVSDANNTGMFKNAARQCRLIRSPNFFQEGSGCASVGSSRTWRETVRVVSPRDVLDMPPNDFFVVCRRKMRL